VRCACQFYLLLLVAGLKSHLFRRTNSEPHKCVYWSQFDVLMKRFTWAELADIHLAYGSAYGKSREVQRICHERFPRSVCPDYCTFTSVGLHLRESGTFAVNRHNTNRGRSVRTTHLMRTFCCFFFRRIPPQALARLATAGVDRRLVWNVVREQELHPFHRQKVQAVLGSRDYIRRDKFIGLFTRVHRSPTFLFWCCSRVTLASPERRFSTATTAMFGQKQTLMLHLFTATNNALWSTFGRALLITLCLGLTCYPDCSVHRFTVCFWRKGPGYAGENPVVSQEKRVVLARQGCGSLCTSGPRTSHRHLQGSLDWTGWTNGLASLGTGRHTNELLPLEPH
jgi:hypothetical protein